MIIRLLTVIFVGLLGAACTSGSGTITPATVASTTKIAATTSPVVQVSGPYDKGLGCLARVPGINQYNIGVGQIIDSTNKLNMAEGGTGSFVSGGASDFFYNALYKVGVSVTDLSPDQKADVTFIASAGVKGSMRTPDYIVRGSISALDLAQQSNVAEATLYGVGPKARAYNASGRMDVRMITLPGGQLPSNVMVAHSTPFKQFLAYEREVGLASFVGAGPGLTFASFRIGGSEHEPMQHTVAFMAEYAAADLVIKLIERMGNSDQKAMARGCRHMIENPYGEPRIQVASAA